MREPTQTEVRRALDQGLDGLRTPGRVVVVGAGLAGLGTAYELARLGCDVTVLEASTRAGGRAYTVREPFADGLYAEAGAMTVTPHCHYVMHYLKELGVGLEPSDLLDADFSYFLGSRFVRPEVADLADSGLPLSGEEKGLDIGMMMERYVRALCQELQPDLGTPEWEVTDRLAPYDRRSVIEVLKERGASDAAITLLEPMFLEMRGGDLDTASALSWLRHESSPRSLTLADDRWAKIRGGTDRFPAAFADRLRDRIHYAKPVVRVTQDDTAARVTFVDGGGFHTMEADRVVLAVPFSAMRRIDLSNAGLSAAKHAAIRQLRYVSIVRVYLQMRERFWTSPRASVSTDLPIRWVRDATPQLPGPRAVLECLMSGWRAKAVTAMSPDERLRFTLEQVERIFPGAKDHFEVGTSVAWDREPYIEGAYILPEVGHTALMPDIRRPEGRVHFAGEHTAFEPNGGSMTYALESAVRAVLELGSSEA
ncbi:NAD(P)/FAD-dependent oxidoreductase [Streptomyces sp. PTM05]|uniref:NAD(P)/FAD-dependent oxidoreductase n=1 Tax=Streptantibioticus parmotrematis TaxID=2873249 RepID=A0ABS7QQI4_9ACTN|nr:FAD-dependent oxidoreductase [Streptantibioticus parmotrematis]MBY8885457.1 NAD(P)/FAD-dependent oxidoreductase [Streptantibioticus parmotrematis]